MMSRIFGIIFLFFFSTNAFSQLTDKENITKAELLENTYTPDTTVPAVILSKRASTYFRYTHQNGFTSFTDVAVKIKILKKEGLKWANFEIPYYTGYKFLNDEMVSVKKAFTYNFENGQINKEKVTGESKFKDKINEYWSVKKLTFPNVKVGSIIEISYELRTENLSEMPEFQFQYDIPVAKMEYITKIPEFYIYKGIKAGHVNISSDAVMESGSQSFDNEHGQTMSMDYQQVKTIYKAENIKALKAESYVNNIKNYYGKIIQELEIIRMPDEEPKHLATTWDDVAKSVYNEKEFGLQLEKSNYFLYDLKLAIKDADSAKVKMQRVFNYVKNKMSWNGRYGYYAQDDVETAYNNRTGNVADVNFILIAMLKLAGLEANPVLLSTRDNGVALFPNKTFLNYVIAAVQIDDKIFLLDATDKSSEIDQIPTRALNVMGRLIKKDGTSTEIELMPKTNSKELINVMAELNEQGSFSGKVRDQYADYNAYVFRENKGGLTKDSQIDLLEKKYQGLEVLTYDVQNETDFSKPIIESYSFTKVNAAETIGDKMYFSPFSFLALTENPFKQETREYPIDFVYPYQTKYNISLKIPGGYTVESLPQSKAIAMPEKLGSFKYNISATENQIQVLCTIDINQASIDSAYYDVLKNFFKEIVSKQTEKIVIKKG